jgi:hypothetical protein
MPVCVPAIPTLPFGTFSLGVTFLGTAKSLVYLTHVSKAGKKSDHVDPIRSGQKDLDELIFRNTFGLCYLIEVKSIFVVEAHWYLNYRPFGLL